MPESSICPVRSAINDSGNIDYPSQEVATDETWMKHGDESDRSSAVVDPVAE
jgi:hypothetical protein